MRNIRLTVAYDGTELRGYQKQPKGATVQGLLEDALSIVCDEPIRVYGASRTDAGVHAKGQEVSFSTSGRIPTENLIRALRAYIPPYVVVKEAKEVSEGWNPRRENKGKHYVYTIFNSRTEDPLSMRYHWHVEEPLDKEMMSKGGQLLVGTHDFTSFQGANSTPADPVKTIYYIGVIQKEKNIYIHVLGDGFLYHMVRNIAGLLVEIGKGKRPACDIPYYLEAKNRRIIGETAPAKGLCLEKVFFSNEEIHSLIENLKQEN